MCASTHGAVAAGPHATIEEIVDADFGSHPELRLIVNVPFRLDSMAEAQLDISSTSVFLKGPAGVSGAEVCILLPNGFALDPDLASARYSRKKQQLTISSPNVGSVVGPSIEVSEPRAPITTPAHTGSSISTASSTSEPRALTALRCAGVSTRTDHGADTDDDDMPPPLEAAHSALKPVDSATPTLVSRSNQNPEDGTLDWNTETNDAAEAFMQRALAAREKKRQETEEARRMADLGSGGLKKGFLSSGKVSKKGPCRTPGTAPAAQNKAKQEVVPFIAAPLDPEAARRESLKLPEVQQALQQGIKNLQTDSSWVTPQLLQAMQSRPNLIKGMSNPHVMEALNLMQSDPDKAKTKYRDDPEVTSFMKEFSSLMATHFEVLGKESGTSGAPTAVAQMGRASSQDAVHAPQFLEPKVAEVMKDPEVQALLGALRAGRLLEMHELCREHPRLFQKMKVLLDAGLLNMQQ